MPELVNSQRRIHKATYVNIRAADTVEDQERRTRIGRPLEKLNFVRTLKLSRAEFSSLAAELDDEGRTRGAPALLDLLRALTEGTSGAANLRFAPAMAKVGTDTLAYVGRLVVRTRGLMAREAQSAIDEIGAAYVRRPGQHPGPNPAERPAVESPAESGLTSVLVGTSASGRRNAGLAIPTLLAPPAASISADRAPKTEPAHGLGRLDVRMPHDEAINWGIEQRVPAAERLQRIARSLRDNERVSAASLAEVPARLQQLADQADDAVQAFIDLVNIEPIGRLHLERMEMTPVGVERGELVYSIPLAPKETVNISHKEWSIRSEEFEQLVEDVFEEFSEKGVSEKNDLAQSTESQQRHATAFTLSGSYSYYGASVSIGYNSSSEDQQAQRDSRQQSISITRKASTRAKREHKQSFKVESVVGREEESVRVISNPSETAPMRIDYYQLMRKWRTDLYRYGLRMTYDIVVPSPGIDLLQKLDEIRVLDAFIDRPFTIPLQPSEIDRDNWPTLAAQWNARLDPPPPAADTLYRHDEIEFRSDDDADDLKAEAVEFTVDLDYTIASADFEAVFPGIYDNAYFDVLGDPEQQVFNKHWYNSTLSHLKGKTGDLAVVYAHRNIPTGSVQFTLTLALNADAYVRWQYEAWAAIREAAEQAYYASQQLLTERRDRLVEELKQWDALTLRRMEREEIMKNVLRWLFGPDFELVPSELEQFFEPVNGTASPTGSRTADPSSNQSSVDDEDAIAARARSIVVRDGPVITDEGQVVLDDGPADSDGGQVPPKPFEPPPLEVLVPTEESWQRAIQFGEMIKFLHHAIEWENVLYFTYPYFWDSPTNWRFKRFLRHPDAIHREFLRAGSARVVLTVRPGYEVDFARFVESGAMGDDHPYLTIAEEIQAYAATNYPGIPPANPEHPENDTETENRERGLLIGRWYEYTPTSAIDLSIDTPFADMA
jgi:hypothetical protein